MKGASWLYLGRIGFRQQLALTFTTGIVCLALASSLAISALSSGKVRAKLIEQGRQATETFAAQSTLALLYYSAENARDAAISTLSFPDIRGAAVYHTDHQVLLLLGQDPLPVEHESGWSRELELDHETEQAWYFVTPVYAHPAGSDDDSPFIDNPPSPELIGFVRIIMSKETLNTMSNDILRGNLLVSGALAAVLLLLLLAVTKRMIIPIKNLADIMAKAERGEEHVRAELRGPKDIVDMESAFNKMMAVLEARKAQLEKARDAALQSARIKGEFAANVSHELRTPINGVLGMLELLQGTGLSPEQRDNLEVARSSAESLLALIEEVLDFSRIELGKVKHSHENFCTREMLDGIVALLSAQAHRKELDLAYVIQPDVPEILCGDSARIRQVLINLVGNAVKFTDQGEVAIEVRTLETQGDTLRFRFDVRDTGIGIPRDAQGNIFEAFYQVDGSTTRRYGGTGLGLAICRQLVAFMGGEIGVESEPGKGSRFWCILPLTKPGRLPAESEEQVAAVAGVRVLIVDDSAANRAFLEQTLRNWGAFVDSAADGLQALSMWRAAAAEQRPYGVTIIDEVMPGIAGFELVRKIADEPAIAHPKVLIMTSQHRPGHSRKPVTGLVSFVATPLRYASLVGALSSLGTHQESKADERYGVDEGDEVFLGYGHILVVEDNRAGQQVAIGMLERLGCQVQVAENGREALDMLGRSSFDLVLMDCHLPQMDGYQTTACIRTLEGGDSHVPILAMTANFQADERERCLSAGMDDFLPKPIKRKLLKEKLCQWLPKRESEMKDQSNRPQELTDQVTADGAPIIDEDGISELREAIGAGFSRLVEVFLEDMPVCLNALDKAIAEHDTEAVIQAAHSVKGMGMNFGANQLVALCNKLDGLARSAAADRAGTLSVALRAEFQRVKAELQQEIQTCEATPPPIEKREQHVLIVDDDRGMRFALRNVLANDGYSLHEAESGSQALELCKRHMPDLVLMDAIMPELDGFVACRRIRQLPGATHTPVLMITALDDEASIERAFLAGASDYVTKPVHFAVLRRRVARLLHASRAEKRMHRLAYNDPLTGLPNRTLFNERIAQLLDFACREGQALAILFVDLDRFKLVNDTLGHHIGDLLLKAVAERSLRCVRGGDLIARLGGDEFTLVLPGVSSQNVVAKVAQKLCNALSRPFVFMGREIYITASIGISMYPTDGQDIGTLVKHADTAMFRAKERGSGYQFYESAMGTAMTQRQELENDLRHALDRNQFVLHFQPQADVANGRITGMEVLIRWQHPTRGLVLPDGFIPLAEETGLILQLGEWVLRTACGHLKAWLRRGYVHLKMAVNVSGIQLEGGDFAQKVKAILDEVNLSPSFLELEITESSIMKHAKDVVATLEQLKQMGITLTIDDFGTGYSSLSYLKRFPIDRLKVDRSFIWDIPGDSDGSAIVTGILALARSLRLEAVAEGVENEKQIEFLRNYRCDLMQGYYISKPLPADVFEQTILQTHRQRRARNM